VTGEKTCAYKKGEFCPFLKFKNFGTTPYCSYFDEFIPENGSVLLRLNECLITFK